MTSRASLSIALILSASPPCVTRRPLPTFTSIRRPVEPGEPAVVLDQRAAHPTTISFMRSACARREASTCPQLPPEALAGHNITPVKSDFMSRLQI